MHVLLWLYNQVHMHDIVLVVLIVEIICTHMPASHYEKL